MPRKKNTDNPPLPLEDEKPQKVSPKHVKKEKTSDNSPKEEHLSESANNLTEEVHTYVATLKNTPKEKNAQLNKTELPPPSPPAGITGRWLKILLPTLACIVLGILAVVSVWKLQNSRPVQRLLPAEKTVAFFTIQTDTTQAAWKNLDTMFEKSGSGALVTQTLGLERSYFDQNIVPWLGGTTSIAWIQTAKGLQTGLVVEIQPNETSQKYWAGFESPDSSAKTEYNGITIRNSTDNRFRFIQIDQYYAISSNREVLQEIIDTYQNKKENLDQSVLFQNIQKNLPATPFIKGYVNMRLAGNPFFSMLLSEKKIHPDIETLIAPFAGAIDGLGIAVDMRNEQNTKLWHTKVSLVGKSELFKMPVDKNTPELVLADKNRSNMLAYLDGRNFLSTTSDILKNMGNLSPQSEIILEGLLNYALSTYISSTLDVATVKDMTVGEYGIFWNTLNDQQGGTGFMAVLPLKNETEGRKRLETAFEDFRSNSVLLFNPQIRNITLPDNTQGKEVFMVPKDIEVKAETIPGGTIHYLDIGDEESLRPGYGIANGNLYVFSHPKILKDYLDSSDTSIPATENIIARSAALRFGGNLSFILPKLVEHAVLTDQRFKNFLAQFSSFSGGISFFDQGMIAEMAMETK